MRFRKLILRNFAAFESLDLTFPQHPVRVIGRNLTDKGQENNGSGKSLIFDGLILPLEESSSERSPTKR